MAGGAGDKALGDMKIMNMSLNGHAACQEMFSKKCLTVDKNGKIGTKGRP
jgi:hypothetical protein